RPDIGMSDRAAASQDLLADRDADAGLPLVAQQRGVLVENLPRSGSVAGREGVVDRDQRLGEGEAGHRADRPALQLLDEVLATQPTEDLCLRVLGEDLGDLLRHRWLFQLDQWQPG